MFEDCSAGPHTYVFVNKVGPPKNGNGVPSLLQPPKTNGLLSKQKKDTYPALFPEKKTNLHQSGNAVLTPEIPAVVPDSSLQDPTVFCGGFPVNQQRAAHRPKRTVPKTMVDGS